MDINLELPKNQNFIDLFCGAGGISCGLELAGWNCILGVDSDSKAMKTFALNHPKAKTFSKSITKLDQDELEKLIGDTPIHLLAGGPPCQGFSTFGEGNPDDEKNFLFKEYCRILNIIRPKFILFENVTGLVAKKNEKVIEQMIKKFHSLGYEIKIKVLESQHYGVPQKRKRTIILGTNTGVELAYPKPTFDYLNQEGEYIPARTLKDALNSLSFSQDGVENIFNHDLKFTEVDTLTRERLLCIPEGRGIRYKKDEDELLPDHLKLGYDWATLREGRLRELRFFRLHSQLPSPTINTKNDNYYHPFEPRNLSVREMASIQSFPATFEFLGGPSSTKKQIGNAVPPLMAKAIGKCLNLLLAKSHDSSFSEQFSSASNYKKVVSLKEDIAEIRSDAFIYNKGHYKLMQKNRRQSFQQKEQETDAP
jgi:DNA (cytosine-5)-methyltransferase 1